ncbi:MAG: hypothetical protein JRN15_17945 [Nitrososphaerota archaeon]|nr:hypothetical protein [Nitrososphaerota archaeon]
MSQSTWEFVFIIIGVILAIATFFKLEGSVVIKWLRTRPAVSVVSVFPGLYRRYYAWRVRSLTGDATADIVKRLAHEFENSGCPYLVPRRHLFTRRLWPHWSYGILVLFQDDIATVTSATDAEGRNVMTLSVDISKDEYGIYRNAGKAWLERHSIINPRGEYVQSVRKILLDHSNDLHQQMLAGRFRSQSEPWTWRNNFINSITHRGDPRLLPLRWSSGGALTFVRLVQEAQHEDALTHVALFYRDLDPTGWNVANGASECEEELADFDKLTMREFSEEMRLYSGASTTGELQEILLYEDGSNTPFDAENAKKFGRTQGRLRRAHDGLRLKREYGVRVVSNATHNSPFRINVTGGRMSTRARRHSVTFTLNPFELGCEVLWLTKFDLYPGEFILDGEVDATGSFLIRRPVILISVDFLKRAYNDGTLEYCHDDELRNAGNAQRYVFDKKYLRSIPKGTYKIFAEELEFAKRRLRTIVEIQSVKWKQDWDSQVADWINGTSSFDTESNKDQFGKMVSGIKNRKMQEEFKMRLMWQVRYGALFDKYARGDRDITDLDLLSFCPTTWKALELVFAHELLEPTEGCATARNACC